MALHRWRILFLAEGQVLRRTRGLCAPSPQSRGLLVDVAQSLIGGSFDDLRNVALLFFVLGMGERGGKGKGQKPSGEGEGSHCSNRESKLTTSDSGQARGNFPEE